MLLFVQQVSQLILVTLLLMKKNNLCIQKSLAIIHR
jgi:hypothetical protein